MTNTDSPKEETVSTWKAVYVEQDTPTEVEGWYVVGDSITRVSPVVLRIEGSDIDGDRERIAHGMVGLLNAADEIAGVTVLGELVRVQLAQP